MSSVVIIGAGAAGLAAAAKLCAGGFDPAQITILEAENRIGGRVHTLNYGGNVIELGAQWVHGEEGNVLFPLANEAGEIRTDLCTLESTGYADNVVNVYPKSGKKITRAQRIEFLSAMDQIYRSAETELVGWKKSLGDYFHHKLDEYLGKGLLPSFDRNAALDMLDWCHRAQNIETSSDNWLNTSGEGFLEYIQCKGDVNIVWKRGYSALFGLLLKDLPTNNNGLQLPLADRIRLNTTVTSVRWDDQRGRSNGKVQVICDRNKTYQADYVIVTCSLGVLKEKADKLFTPPLPEQKRKAIANLGYGVVDKIFLHFRKPWWNSGWGGVNFLFDTTLRTSDWTENVLGFFTVRNQPCVLEGWVTGDAAREVEGLPEAEVKRRCSELLRKAVCDDFPDYTEPTGMVLTKWYSNPHFRGSYSYRSNVSQKGNVWASDLAAPVTDSYGAVRLLFAGEATHDHYYSNVHAAIETGWREADRILKLTQGFGKQTIPAKL